MMNNDLRGRINHSQKAGLRTAQSVEDIKSLNDIRKVTIGPQ